MNNLFELLNDSVQHYGAKIENIRTKEELQSFKHLTNINAIKYVDGDKTINKTNKDDNIMLYNITDKYFIADCDNEESFLHLTKIMKNNKIEGNITKSISNTLFEDYKFNHHFWFKLGKVNIFKNITNCNGGKLDLLSNVWIVEDINAELINIPTLNESLLSEIKRFEPKEPEIKQNTSYGSFVHTKFRISDYLPEDFETNSGTIAFITQLLKANKDENKFLWIKKSLYCWTGSKWQNNNHQFVKFLSKDLYNELKIITDKICKDFKDVNYPESNNFKIFKSFQKKMIIAEKCWKNQINIKNIIAISESHYTNDDVKFDEKPDLLGFNNGCFDFSLKPAAFRLYKKEDFMTISCGYNFVETKDPEKEKVITDLLQSIMPNPENYNLLLEILSKGLLGEAVEKFILFNNSGRNGKGLINDFMSYILGDYCYNAPVAILFEKEKTGGSPEIATINKKRYVIMKEPSNTTKFNNGRVKELTGKGTINGRMLQSNETKVKLDLLLVLECNNKPEFSNEPTVAEYERIIDLEFPNTFTTDDLLVNNINVFKADAKYKEDTFREEYKMSFMHILIQYAIKLRANKYVFTVPLSVKQRGIAYLKKSFPIITFFENVYEKTDDKNCFVKVMDVVDMIHSSEEYSKLSKKEQSDYTNKKIRFFIENDSHFKNDYYPKKTILKESYKNILMGYKLIIDTDRVEAAAEATAAAILKAALKAASKSNDDFSDSEDEDKSTNRISRLDRMN